GGFFSPMHTNSRSALSNKSYISIDSLSVKTIQELFKLTHKMSKMTFTQTSKILRGKLVTLLFFEPSSRTFSSFSAAVKKLGGTTIEYQNPLQTSSSIKGETLEDTMRVFENYSDAVVMRHFEKGTLQRAADAVKIPVINAGDGIGEHPTQALLDAYTIFQTTKSLSGLTGLMVGDLLNGRTVHSLLKLLSLYKNNTIYLLSPKQLKLEKSFVEYIRDRGVTLIEITKQEEIPSTCNFWYWTRVQKERFTNKKEYELLKNRFVVTLDLMKEKGNKKMILMHPLPRVGDIDVRVDADPRAVYLSKQVKNGLHVRMALLSLILG
ncbi:MAG: aspartate carbamoyltransferase, partial [Candidatus Roizmanbacteria bacterium]|nr:aspartate carbamoyltransferase [Candidatus Roizmanbacteria bacterium]